MGWKDWFGKKEEAPQRDLLRDLTLANMKVGDMVDYDMKSWQVASVNTYDWGGGELTYEWQLKSHDDTIYLEREPDDEDSWSVSRPIRLTSLGSGLREHIRRHDDPPSQITYEDRTYHLEESSAGKFYRNGKGPGDAFVAWEYWDEEETHMLSIEQWGEDEFEAGVGQEVEEYQFSNILPGTEK